MKRGLYPSWRAYLDRLVPLLLELVVAVRDEGPAEVSRLVMECRRLPTPEGVDPVEAVVVALAAAVDPDAGLAKLWEWCDRLVPEPVQLRQRASRSRYRVKLVELAVQGDVPFGVLGQRERGDAALARWRAGESWEALAAWTGLPVCEVRRLVERAEAREYKRVA